MWFLDSAMGDSRTSPLPSKISFPLYTAIKTASSMTLSSKLDDGSKFGSFAARHPCSRSGALLLVCSCFFVEKLARVSAMCRISTPGTILYSASWTPRILTFSVVASSGPWYPALDVGVRNFSVVLSLDDTYGGARSIIQVVLSLDE